jgi:hypothetical protein
MRIPVSGDKQFSVYVDIDCFRGNGKIIVPSRYPLEHGLYRTKLRTSNRADKYGLLVQ